MDLQSLNKFSFIIKPKKFTLMERYQEQNEIHIKKNSMNIQIKIAASRQLHERCINFLSAFSFPLSFHLQNETLQCCFTWKSAHGNGAGG